MAEPANVVEINGKRYDATTGQLLEKVKPNKLPENLVIDGFQKKSSSASFKTARIAPKTAPVRREQQKTYRLKKEIQGSSEEALNTISSSKFRQKKSPVGKIDSAKLENSKQHSKSSFISRYGARIDNQPQQQAQMPASRVDAPIPPPPTPKTIAPLGKQKSSNHSSFIFRKPKLSTALAGVLIAVILGGYMVYLNIPNISMKVASSRAGFDASVPSYSPNGFGFAGPVEYSPGQITLKFSANTDDRSYKISQIKSNWDSQSLLDNHVSLEHPQYLTFQERGLTIYVFDGSNATWVDGGVWYTIEGNSQLNSEQLLKIAGSL